LPIRLLAIAFAGGDPLTPFVIGEEGAGDDDSDNDGEKDFHGVLRIARTGRGRIGRAEAIEQIGHAARRRTVEIEFQIEICWSLLYRKGFLHWISLTLYGTVCYPFQTRPCQVVLDLYRIAGRVRPLCPALL